MTQNNRPLTRKHRIGYALGDFGGCMTFSLMSAFLTRYYVNVALMDTAMIAGMTLAWKRFDALSNPVIGVMLDKSFAKGSGRGDKFRPWIFRVSPLTGFAGILVFTAPGWVAGMSRLVVAFSTYLMYEVCYAAQHIALGVLSLPWQRAMRSGQNFLPPGASAVCLVISFPKCCALRCAPLAAGRCSGLIGTSPRNCRKDGAEARRSGIG